MMNGLKKKLTGFAGLIVSGWPSPVEAESIGASADGGFWSTSPLLSAMNESDSPWVVYTSGHEGMPTFHGSGALTPTSNAPHLTLEAQPIVPPPPPKDPDVVPFIGHRRSFRMGDD